MRATITVGLALTVEAMTACTMAPQNGDQIPDAPAGVPTGGGQPPADAGGVDSAAPPSSPGVGPYFTTPMFFNRDVSNAAKAANSATIINALVAEGGWGN